MKLSYKVSKKSGLARKPLIKRQEAIETVYVVVTTNHDQIRDVVMVTDSKIKAQNLTKKLQKHQPKDFNLLLSYNDAAYFTRKLNSVSCWKYN
jgi:hypothetical protein